MKKEHRAGVCTPRVCGTAVQAVFEDGGRDERMERRGEKEGGRHGAVLVNTIQYPPPEHFRFTPFHTVSHSRCSVSLRLLPGALPAPVHTVQAGAYII